MTPRRPAVRRPAVRRPAVRPPAVRRRHAHAAPHKVVCAIITVSDTRGRADDRSGDALERRLARGGHTVASRDWVRDEALAIRRRVRAALATASSRDWVRDEALAIRRRVRAALSRPDVDAVLVTGGTGVAARDVTPEAVGPLVSRWLPGFGELFRALSYRQVGSAAWLSRASAGIARGRLLVILPGSPAAVRLAADRLLVPELAHVARLLGRLEPGE